MFLKGELLRVDRLADTVNGRHNILVMSPKGETGDILHSIVKKVPSEMSVLVISNSNPTIVCCSSPVCSHPALPNECTVLIRLLQMAQSTMERCVKRTFGP